MDSDGGMFDMFNFATTTTGWSTNGVTPKSVVGIPGELICVTLASSGSVMIVTCLVASLISYRGCVEQPATIIAIKTDDATKPRCIYVLIGPGSCFLVGESE